MLKQRARFVAGGLRLLDLLTVAVALPLAYFIRDGLLLREGLLHQLPGLYPIEFYWPVIAVSLLVWIATAWATQLYQAYRTQSLSAEAARLLRTVALVGLVVASSQFIWKTHDLSRLLFALYVATAFCLLVGSRVALRLVARAARRRGYNTRTYAVVGFGEAADDLIEGIRVHREWGFSFAGHILPDDASPPEGVTVLGRLSQLEEILNQNVLDLVVFAAERERLEDIEQAVLLCEERGVAVKVSLNLFPSRIARVSVEDFEGVPMLAFSSTPADVLPLAMKRIFDLVVSAVVLVAFAPLFALIAAAIQLDSPGPVFFRQRRVGLNGREFTLLKFRSMVDGAEHQLERVRALNEMDGPVFKSRSDPRVTRVGRVLRKFSLDEFPQFWNVLRGEMSVVGPRPPLADEVRRYTRWQRRRLSVRPGITCTWQVSGRNEIDFHSWMKLDLEYIDTWTFWRDIGIVLRTIPAILVGRGAH
jgi:exopolysaccharide biosynthesis polyprenyl glycosylphosphotransferase